MRLHIISLIAITALTVSACSSKTEPPAQVQAAAPTTPTPIQPAPVQPAGYDSLEEELRAEVGDRVFFAFDRSDLQQEARQTVQGLAAWMQERPNLSILVEGHTDERGTRAYNLALGERRASSVKRYLVSLGVQPRRVSTVSLGEENPDPPGSNEYAWSLNRRARFVVQ